ncbi:MAG: hypothetical protein KF760_31880 [Candidatus Eremiobacteraeota bacterium]|nr:hypothetical protein [Candidatus Eremiobacteraeota bacterium]MCW5869437.1 hypothetical protein [Candidatus Eremiobacteraeota bacterium]
MHYEEWKAKKRREEAEAQANPFEPAAAGAEASPPPPDGSEDFQWNEDRDRAIQELLETTVPGTLPAVHVQIQMIRHGLIEKTVAPERARQLLSEVDQYLTDLIRKEEAKVPIDHPDVSKAREEKLKALYAWRESSGSLSQYSQEDRQVFLDVAAYAADQGSAFLATARRLLLQCEPEPEDQ